MFGVSSEMRREARELVARARSCEQMAPSMLECPTYTDANLLDDINGVLGEQATKALARIDVEALAGGGVRLGELADGSPGEGDADHIGIGRDIPAFDFVEDSASFWTDYDGQRVCVAGNPWFQTDVSLPYAPRMYDAQLLYVE